ncbi:MAG: hypothetical protein R3C49_01215 [Planctomycetaceae bacterium]
MSVQVIGSTAYVADGGSGLRVLNVSAGQHHRLGFFDTPGFAQGVQVIGSTAYVADGVSGLRVLDVSDRRPSSWVSSPRRASPMVLR